jgi:DNA-binding protein HU-beta
MSKAFIAASIQNSAEITGVAANRTADAVVDAIKVKAGKTVRFKASPTLKKLV